MVRLKSRYLTVCVETGDGFFLPGSHQFLEALKASVAENFGVFGAARVESSLHVHHLEVGSNMFCVRCPRAARTMVNAAITFITELGEGVPVVCSVLAVRGVLRKASFKRR
jgi:RNase P/RNase MRP subunit POP5